MNENDGERSSTTATLVVVATRPDHQSPCLIESLDISAARIRGGSFGAAARASGHGDTLPMVTVCPVSSRVHAAGSESIARSIMPRTRIEVQVRIAKIGNLRLIETP